MRNLTLKTLNPIARMAGVCAFFLLSNPAWATSNIFCSGIDSDADVNILIGGGPILTALETDIVVGERAISTRELKDADVAVIAQFSADDQHLILELINDQADQHLASIRLLRHIDDDGNSVQIGLLRIDDALPMGIACEGP